MAKKKVDGEQPQAAVEVGSQSENRVEQSSEKKSAGIVTTEGKTIDRIRIFQREGATMVQAEYGRLNPNGKTSEERRADMRVQVSRALSPEQSVEYQRLSAESPVKAKEYAVRSAYPMHVDDAAFHKRDTEVNGRKVNYIITEKLDASKLSDANKHLAGAWQLSFGEKGKADSRFYGIMNKEEIASVLHRAEVTLDDEGKLKSIGKPLTLADIAGRVEQRVIAQRQALAAKKESAQKVDWSKFTLPEGAHVTGLRYSTIKEDPDHVRLNANVNGIKVSGLLSKNETTAVKNKLATLEQVGAANKEFCQKVREIISNSQSVTAGKDAAVKAIIDRASDAVAKRFTPEQRDVLEKYVASTETPEAREKAFAGLWEKAETALKDAGVNEAWQNDAHNELNDLAHGVVREEGQGMKR